MPWLTCTNRPMAPLHLLRMTYSTQRFSAWCVSLPDQYVRNLVKRHRVIWSDGVWPLVGCKKCGNGQIRRPHGSAEYDYFEASRLIRGWGLLECPVQPESMEHCRIIADWHEEIGHPISPWIRCFAGDLNPAELVESIEKARVT